MSATQPLQSGQTDFKLWQNVLKGEESAATTLFSNHCGRSLLYWSSRYFPAGDYPKPRAEFDLHVEMKANGWLSLRKWNQTIPLTHFMDRAIIEICHLRLKELGRSGHLSEHETDWTLRDRLIAGHDDAASELLQAWRAPLKCLAREYFPGEEYSSNDFEQDLIEHLLKNDGKVLWAWEGKALLKTYLRKIVASICGQKLRKAKRCPLFHLSDSHEGTETEEDRLFGFVSPNDPSTRITFLKAIALLTQDRDRVYFHRILAGHDPDDAGWGLVNPTAFPGFKKRAMDRLRKILLEMGYGK